MNSVTSNAVAAALSYLWTEVFTGKYWVNGKQIYRKTVSLAFTNDVATGVQVSNEVAANDYQVMDLAHSYIYNSDYGTRQPWASNLTVQNNIYIANGFLNFLTNHPSGTLYAVCEYTKTI